jgi:hypothetical protein
MRTLEQEGVYRPEPVWIWNKLENSFSKESGYWFFSCHAEEIFLISFTTRVVGPFSLFPHTTTFRRLEIFSS